MKASYSILDNHLVESLQETEYYRQPRGPAPPNTLDFQALFGKFQNFHFLLIDQAHMLPVRHRHSGRFCWDSIAGFP